MAEQKIESSVRTAQDSLGAAPDQVSLTGASSTWGAQVGGTTNDDLVFDPPIRGVHVGTAGGGALKLELVSGRIDTMKGLAASGVWRSKIRKVFAVGTTIEDPTFFW